MATILTVVDDTVLARTLEGDLASGGHVVLPARGAHEIRAALDSDVVDVVIAQAQSRRVPNALDLVEQFRRDGHGAAVLVLASGASAEHATAAIRAGAAVVVPEPVQRELLAVAVEQSLAFARLRRELGSLRREVTGMRRERQIVAESPAMRRAMQAVAMAAPTRASVLVHGESGSGRSLLARALHDGSEHCDGPFVALSCGDLPERVLESILFGNECDPFTGAPVPLEGAVERAHGGTLVLDGIEQLPEGLHARVMRLMQRQEYERAGSDTVLRASVRVVGTSLRDPASMNGTRSRSELLTRLTTLSIAVPPLRERVADIPMLAHRLALRSAAELGRRFDRFAPDALAVLRRAPWPGNVRELRDLIERALVADDAPVVSADRVLAQLPRAEQHAIPASSGDAHPAHVPPNAVVLTTLNVDEAERALIEKALAITNQNRTRTAALLGISVRTLRNKLNGPHRLAGPAVDA